MLIILSQKIDAESSYADDVFSTYHYPARYKNQIHEGDTFVYYQGNRFVKEQRYYFGTGTVGEITTPDGENYYAALINVQKFANKVPIYLPSGEYVEQLGYDTIRNSPPWQSSVRPLSQEAFDYILSASGIERLHEEVPSVEDLNEKLKASIRSYYLDGNKDAINTINKLSSDIIKAEKFGNKKQ